MPEAQPSWAGRGRVIGICLALAVLTFAVFGQTFHHGFIDCDDGVYVFDNPVVAAGWTAKGVDWVFTHADCGMYHPLTLLSLMADHQFHGAPAGGYHLTNVLLHGASAILLFLVLLQLTGAAWRSGMVAALFAIHPLHVESVAWVAERKDMLSGFFFMLTLGAFVQFARGAKAWGWYGLALVCFVAGLLSKPMVVTLPAVLFLLDYWPLQRKEPWRELVLEKLPFLVIAAVSCAVTLLVQDRAVDAIGAFSIWDRVGNALTAYVIYLRQMVWPVGLAAFYPYPRGGLPWWEPLLAGVLVAGISAVAIWRRKRAPWLLMGWLWYLVVLLPVSGIIQIGQHAHADRYTYLSQIGLYVALTWLVAGWRVNWAALGGAAAGIIVLLTICARRQAAYWQDDETLWPRAIACTVDNDTAHNDLGVALSKKGDAAGAIFEYKTAVAIRPGNAPAHFNLAKALLHQGKAREGMAEFEAVLQIDPNDMEVTSALAWMLATVPDAALRDGEKAVHLAQQANDRAGGKNLPALLALAAGLAETKRFPEAIATAQKAIELAQTSGRKDVLGRLKVQLRRYQSGRPNHE